MTGKCDGSRPSCATCLKANILCEYDTEHPQEKRSQAVKRQAADLREARSTVNDSLAWLQRQSPDTVLSCIRRIQHAEDAAGQLCSVVAQYRSQSRGPGISLQDVLSANANVAVNSQTAELLVRFRAAFPRLPESKTISVLKIDADHADEYNENIAA